ncbi:CopD family protein [Rhizobium sp. DKSPLA3]|uniref:Protoporphyrinogen IX oxidase n=1 Tax=Rhizobium quercicola TaxID=2901226 RepID=A0A9X1NV20_9HYPH|nr:CopD family protein [Rhizobium quercicola]MCD7110900.1 CopD family protein [Rhizobium quercicola]
MSYLLIKSLHVATMVAWIGGMVLLSAIHLWLARAQCPRTDRETAVITTVRRWDGRVTSPAMGLTWLFGLVAAWQGDWFTAPWLHAKLLLVVFLSALHGMLSGALRRTAADPNRLPPAFARHAGAIVLVTMLVIVLLVVVKPF